MIVITGTQIQRTTSACGRRKGAGVAEGKMIRVVSRESDGSIRIRDYESIDSVSSNYDQTGIDDCSTELSLRGMPIFRGLIGPFADGKRIARYETADVFEVETRQWAQLKSKRRRGGKKEQSSASAVFPVLDAVLPLDSAWSTS